MIPKSETEQSRNWFFQRCRFHANAKRNQRGRKKRGRKSSRPLFAEILEPRVLFSGSPVPEVAVDATQPVRSELITPVDGEGTGTRQGPNLNGSNANAGAGEANEEMLEEHFTFTVEFENAATGGGNTGYGPYIDVVVSEAVEIDAPAREMGESTDIELLVSDTRAIALTNTQVIGKVYNAEDLAIADEAVQQLTDPGYSSAWRAYGTDNVWVRPSLSFAGAAAAGPTASSPGGNPVFNQHPLLAGHPSGRLDANDYQAGDKFYVARLPVGSMTEGQSPLNIRFTGRLDQDPHGDSTYGAKEGQAIDIRARGGFYLGSDPEDNPDEDAPIAHLENHGNPPANNNLFVSDEIIPRVVEVVKRGPDDTALGPSDVMNFQIEVDIAAGQTVDDLVLEEIIPAGLVYVPNSLQISFEYMEGIPTVDNVVQPTGDGTLRIEFGELTAGSNFDPITNDYLQEQEEDLFWNTAGGPDFRGDNVRHANIYITYQAYAGDPSVLGGATIGNPNYNETTNRLAVDLTTDASVTGNFTDAEGNVVVVSDDDTGSGVNNNQRVDSDSWTEDVSGLIGRKVLTARYDNGGNLVSAGPNTRNSIPGDIIEYTLEMSASDFLSFDQLNFQDYLDDGLAYYENTSLNVGDSVTSTTTFQSYWALYQDGVDVVGATRAGFGSELTFEDVSTWEVFTSPHIEANVAIGNNYVNNIHEPANFGKDLLTWNLSTEALIEDGATSTATIASGLAQIALANADSLLVDLTPERTTAIFDETVTVSPVVTNLSFEVTLTDGAVLTVVPDPSNAQNLLVVQNVTNGDPLVTAYTVAWTAGNAPDFSADSVTGEFQVFADGVAIDVTAAEATYDRIHRFGALVDRDVDGDGTVSAEESTLVGGGASLDRNNDGLADGFDTDSDGELDVQTHLSGNIDGGFRFDYDAPADFVVDAQTHGVDPISSDGRTLNRDIDPSDKLFIRFFARVEGSQVNESGTGDDDVNLRDSLYNNSIAEGVQVIGGETIGTDFIPTDNDELVRDADQWHFEVEGGQFRKFTVAVNGESILDADPNDGVTDQFDNVTGDFGADGNVDNPVLKIGDTITYRLRAELPLAQAENLFIEDFLPLPVFDVSTDYPNGAVQMVTGSSAAQYAGDDATGIPGVGQSVLGNAISWTYGPDHNIPDDVIQASNGDPIPDLLTYQGTVTDSTSAPPFSVTFNPNSNSVVWNFGTISQDINSANPGAVIDILFTVELNAQQFSDDFELSNTARTNFTNSNDEQRGPGADITSVDLLSPDLNIRKGVIAVTPGTSLDGPELIGNDDGEQSDLAFSGPDAEFADADHSQTNNTFNALTLGAGNTETIEDEVLVEIVNGALSAHLDRSNIVPGEPVTLEITHNGTVVTLTDNGTAPIGNFTVGTFPTGGGNQIVVNSGTINYQTGEIIIDADVTSEYTADFGAANNQLSVTGATVLNQVNNNVLTSDNLFTGSGVSSARTVIPGSVELTVEDTGFTDFPTIRDTDHNGDGANGALYLINFDSGGSPVSSSLIGRINYVTGDYNFRIQLATIDVPVSLSADFDHAGQTASTITGTAVDGVSNFNSGSAILPGTVNIDLNGYIIVDNVGAPAGQLFQQGGDGTPIGTIDYRTGAISFSAVDSVPLTADYTANSGPGIITSEYIHGVNDFTGETQLENFSDFVDSNVRNVDAGDVLTYGIFVENVGAERAFDIKIADEILAGLDTLNADLSTSLTGADSASDLLAALNLQIWRGDGTALAEGTDYNVEFTPGTNVSADMTGLLTGTQAVPGTLPASSVIIPGSYEIIIDGDVGGSIAHQLRIFDEPVLNATQGLDNGGVGRLHYLNPSTGSMQQVGTINYVTGQITWSSAIVNSDGTDVTGNAATINYDVAELLSANRGGPVTFGLGNTPMAESETNGASKSSFRTVVDQSELVPGSVTVLVDYFGRGELEFRDDMQGGFTLVSAPGIAAITNVDGSIDYENGEVNISWDDTWDGAVTYKAANTTGGTATTLHLQFSDSRALHNIGGTVTAPSTTSTPTGPFDTAVYVPTGGAIIPGSFDLVIAQEAGVTAEDRHYLDDGRGNLVRDDNQDGAVGASENFIVGAINYSTGEFSLTHQNSDRDNGTAAIGTLNYELADTTTLSDESETVSLVDGSLTGHTLGTPAGQFILPGTVSITNLEGGTPLHETITDDGLGNLVIIDNLGQEVRVGTVDYSTSDIDIDYAELQDIALDYATTNAFRLHFNNAAGTLEAGRTASSELPDNESGSNVLVITYDLEVGDEFNPNEEFANTAAIDGYSATAGGANVLIDNGGGAVNLERPTDAATAEGTDATVQKRLMSTNQDHTTFTTFQAVTIEFNDGSGLNAADFTINNTATGSFDANQQTNLNTINLESANAIGVEAFRHRNTSPTIYLGDNVTINLNENTGFFDSTDTTRYSATSDASDGITQEGIIYIPGVTDNPDLSILQIGSVMENTPWDGTDPALDGIGTFGQYRGSVGLTIDPASVTDANSNSIDPAGLADDGSGLREATQLIAGTNTVSSPAIDDNFVSPFSTVFTIPDYPTYTWGDGTTVGAFMNGFDIIVDPGGPNEAHYSTNSRDPLQPGNVDFSTLEPGNLRNDIFAKGGNLPSGITPGTIVGHQDIDLDGEADLDEDGQIRFLESINPNGDNVILTYIYGVPEASVSYYNTEQPVALDWETNFEWTVVGSGRDGGNTTQGMSFVIQADPDGANAIGLTNPAETRFTGVSNHGVRGDSGFNLEPHIEIKFDYDWNRDGDGNVGEIVIARDGATNGRTDLQHVEFPFTNLINDNIAGAQGDHVRGGTGDTSLDTTNRDTSTPQWHQFNAANFDANIQYDSGNETLTIVVNALDDTGTVIATSGPIVQTNFNVVDLLGSGSAFVGFGASPSLNNGSANLITSFDFTGTFSNDQHHQNVGTQGEDVAIGEIVDFALIVDVPEGTTEHLSVTDILPAGLELLDVEIITTQAASGGLLDADFGGTIDPSRFTVDIGTTTTNLTRAQVQTQNPNGPEEIVIRLEQPIVNNHDAVQDSTGDDETDVPVSFNNDKFLIRVSTRVLNGVDYDPLADGVLPDTVGATPTEVTDAANGNVGLNTDLSDNSHDPTNLDGHDHADLLNDVRLQYLDGDGADLDTDAGGTQPLVTVEGNSVEIDLVEPQLKINKELVNTSRPGGSIVQVGESAFFVVEIEHTQLAEGDAAQSTADAFNVNIFDNLTAGNGLLGAALSNGEARIVKLEILSAPGYINGGDPGALYDLTGQLPVVSNPDGIFTSNIADYTSGAETGRGMPDGSAFDLATNIQNNILDFTLDRLDLGDKFVFAYEIAIDNPSLVNSDLGGVGTNDVENEAHITYYSLPVDGNGDNVIDSGLEEIREYTASDSASIQVVENDVQINIVKGVLAVNSDGNALTDFTTDATSTGAGTGTITSDPWAAAGESGHATGFPISDGTFFNPGPITINGTIIGETNPAFNSQYLEVSAADGATLANGVNRVLPGSVTLSILTDPDGDTTAEVNYRVTDRFGDGDLYYERRIGTDGSGDPIWRTIDIGDGAVGSIDYVTGDYAFNIPETSTASFRFSESLRGDVIRVVSGTSGTVALPQPLIVPGTFEVFADGLTTTPLYTEPATPNGTLVDGGGTQVAWINYAKGEVTFLSGVPSVPAATISYTYSATSEVAANDELPDATNGATTGTLSSAKQFTVPGSYEVVTGDLRMMDVFADGRLFVVDSSNNPILLDSSGNPTTDPALAIPVGTIPGVSISTSGVTYPVVASVSFDLPTAIANTGNTTAYDNLIRSQSITADYQTYEASTNQSLTSEVLHAGSGTTTQWNEFIDRDLTEANGGVNAGDIVTFGIFVENSGRDSAFDLVLTDGLFDFQGNDVLFDGATLGDLANGTIDASVVASAINLQVYRGNGEALTYTLDYVGGDLQITIDEELDGANPLERISGENVFMITYDVEVQDSFGAGDFIGNVSRVESYAAADGGGAITVDQTGANLNVSTTDSAFVEGQGVSITKEIVSTSEDSTARSVTGIDAAGAPGAVFNLESHFGLQAGSVTLTDGGQSFTDDGNGFIVETLTSVSDNGTDTITLVGDEIVSGAISNGTFDLVIGWDGTNTILQQDDGTGTNTLVTVATGTVVGGNTVFTFPATAPYSGSYQQSLAAVDYVNGTVTLSDTANAGATFSYTTDSTGNTTQDVVAGEEVVYRLAVTVPEGTTNGLVLTDSIPDGLEVLSVSVDTSTFVGTVPDIAVAGDTFTGTLNAAGPLAVDGAVQGAEDLVFTVGNLTVGHDQDTSNDQFVILVTTRVQNGLEYNPVANLGDPAITTVDDLNNTGEAASLSVGDILTNTVSYTYNDAAVGGSQNASGSASTGSASVDVEYVQPELTLAKVVDSPIVEAGTVATYTLSIGHDTASAADAHGIHILDKLTETPLVDPASPAAAAFNQGNFVSITVTKTLADGSTESVTINNIDSVANTYTTTPASSPLIIANNSDFTTDKLDILIDSLAVGETLAVTYQVEVGVENGAVTDAMVLDDNSSISSAPSTDDPGTDINNTVHMGWFSTTIDPSDPNPEVAQLQLTSSASVEVVTSTDLQITKTDGQVLRHRDEVYVYDLTVTNTDRVDLGNGVDIEANPAAIDVVVTDVLPEGLLFDPFTSTASALGGGGDILSISYPGGATPVVAANFVGATLAAQPNPGDWAYDAATREITLFLGNLSTDSDLSGQDNPNIVQIRIETQVDPVLDADLPGTTSLTNTATVNRIGRDTVSGDLILDRVIADPNSEDNTASDTNIVSVGDLTVTKDDGTQQREEGESYEYTLTVSNAEVHTDGILAGISGSPATNVVLEDILPEFLEFNENVLVVTDNNTGASFSILKTTSATPQIGQFTVVEEADGSTRITMYLGGMSHTSDTSLTNSDGNTLAYHFSNSLSLQIPVKVLDELPQTFSGTVEILSRVTVTSDTDRDGAFDINLTPENDNDQDIDELILGSDFIGGSQIFQGFRLIGNFQGVSEDDDAPEEQPILTMMPFYSGSADPGTVLNIKIVGSEGGAFPNGEVTVVADAAGGWLAKLPGLILTDEPHVVVITQTAPAWDQNPESHGYNLRTYFAPAIAKTHTQVEELTVGTVMGRRLSSVSLENSLESSREPNGNINEDWRAKNYEYLPKSVIAGM